MEDLLVALYILTEVVVTVDVAGGPTTVVAVVILFTRNLVNEI